MAFAPDDYGPAVASLLAIDAPYALVCGRPVAVARPLLESLDLAAGKRIADRAMADAALAGLWLRFDFFDESHALSQDIDTPTGSYWHAILHRREPDYGNAKYWFARVGRHPVYDGLVTAIAHLPAAREHGLATAWNAAKFVDLCQRAASDGGALEALCRQVQLVEWRLLFDHCYRHALGAAGGAR
jgi:hypothetical protein